MTALIRIKRHLNENPLDAVILNCKRRKVEDESLEKEPTVSTILKLATTIENPDDAFKHIHKSMKEEPKEMYKKHITDITSKIRRQHQDASKSSRLKIINSYRSDMNTNVDQSNVENYTIVDIEAEENDDHYKTEQPHSSKTDFVYDLYYTNSDDFGEADLNEFVGVYPLSEGLVYSNCQNESYMSDTDNSEDSNAENNWKNDYPDESDVESDMEHKSITEDDMISAVNRMNIRNDSVSSDEYDNVYGKHDDFEQKFLKFSKSFNTDDNDDDDYFESYDESCTP